MKLYEVNTASECDDIMNVRSTDEQCSLPERTLQRAYCLQKPNWQRFLSSLVNPATTNGSTAGVGSKKSTTTSSAGYLDDSKYPYLRQYSHVYHQRLSMLGPFCWQTMERDVSIEISQNSSHEQTPQPQDSNNDNNHKNYNNDNNDNNRTVIRVERILELRENTRSVAVGTLVKETSVVPLENEKGNDGNVLSTLHPKSVCMEDDQLFLEDDSGRVALEFVEPKDAVASTDSLVKHHYHQYCSGIVIGVLGTVGVDGVMTVEKVYLPTSSAFGSTLSKPLVNPTPLPQALEKLNDPHLLLMSGLHCGSPESSSLPRDMLLSFLQGALGVTKKAAHVSHVICAGGLIGSSSQSSDVSTSTTIYGCNELDAFCYQMTQQTGVPITLLPGRDDPTTASWPQRPLHRSLLPLALRSAYGYSKLVSVVPNPYAATYECPPDVDDLESFNRYVVGSDGTNVQDLTKRLLLVQRENMLHIEKDTTNDDNSENDIQNTQVTYQPISELQALEWTLRWGHICPTGPDTVPTTPHGPDNPDPMVLLRDITSSSYTLPSVYFSGNSTKFATRLVSFVAGSIQTTTRIICIPKFSETGEVVLLNLKTLDVELLRFED